jgi:hypothetical protein
LIILEIYLENRWLVAGQRKQWPSLDRIDWQGFEWNRWLDLRWKWWPVFGWNKWRVSSEYAANPSSMIFSMPKGFLAQQHAGVQPSCSCVFL